ncbi:hypothetical protein LIER_27706 [Lithospermum erythrorhizon]|uniref:Integrase zinc-binding domain-containing protein n=1 Tax=Lithospermum erythrorhizon TaxID=34254 RepID=A0AAV3RF12_LITER
MYEGEIYRKSFEGPLLLCVSQGNMQMVLYEVHSRWYGSYIGGRSLATKITRIGFFSPIMIKDSTDFVMKCEACQNLGNVPKKWIGGVGNRPRGKIAKGQRISGVRSGSSGLFYGNKS